jgi:hypothetical protein
MSRENPDRRTPATCAFCEAPFLRSQNTRFCSDLCRLLDKVDVADCWTWAATRDRHGYGTFYLGGRNVGAHRAAWSLLVGPIPDGLHLDHLCANPPCVNPDHLDLVTQRENTLRGNAPTAAAYREGRCKSGHKRTPENTYAYGTRRQQCRTCALASRAAREGRAA